MKVLENFCRHKDFLPHLSVRWPLASRQTPKGDYKRSPCAFAPPSYSQDSGDEDRARLAAKTLGQQLPYQTTIYRQGSKGIEVRTTSPKLQWKS